MAKKIYVGNFSFDISEEALKECFAEVGTVESVQIMKEGASGRSRGFGFVEMSSEEEAKKAIEELNGKELDGRPLKVTEDKRGTSSGGGHRRNDYSRDGGDEGRSQKNAPMGYFRAQPLELSFKKRKKMDPFVDDESLVIDYKDPKLLQRFMSERGRILPRRMTGLTSMNQRLVNRAIKRAQHLALLPIKRA